MSKENHLELDRLVFFSDAVIAIAITLLALDLRLEKTDSGVLSFNDIGHLWTKFFSFFLSFILIAVFWRVHHRFFYFIRKIDNRILWYNIFWLLFIIIYPFSTTLVSGYFGQKVSVFFYSVNTLLITLFQNLIWDYVAVRPDYLNERATKEIISDYRVSCNIAMLNAVLAIGFSFISPLTAFIILFIRPVMLVITRKLLDRRRVTAIKKSETHPPDQD